MRKLFTILAVITFYMVSVCNNYAQVCYPLGFQVKGEPWAANDIISATAVVANTTPAGVVDVSHNDVMNFIFDAQLGSLDSVTATPVVTHQTGWTPPANPISGSDFTAIIDMVNPAKIRMTFTPNSTHQIAVGDVITISFTFATGNAVTAPVTFYSSVAGFGQNLPSNTITIQ